MSADARRDLGLRAGTLSVPVRLAPHVRFVRTGTPLTPGPLGWEIAPPPAIPEGFAGTSAQGGELVGVVRSAILAADSDLFLAGQHYRLADVWWQGHPVFAPDPDGPYLAWSPHELYVEAGVAGAPVKAASVGERVEPRSAPPPVGSQDDVTPDSVTQEEHDGAW